MQSGLMTRRMMGITLLGALLILESFSVLHPVVGQSAASRPGAASHSADAQLRILRLPAQPVYVSPPAVGSASPSARPATKPQLTLQQPHRSDQHHQLGSHGSALLGQPNRRAISAEPLPGISSHEAEINSVDDSADNVVYAGVQDSLQDGASRGIEIYLPFAGLSADEFAPLRTPMPTSTPLLPTATTTPGLDLGDHVVSELWQAPSHLFSTTDHQANELWSTHGGATRWDLVTESWTQFEPVIGPDGTPLGLGVIAAARSGSIWFVGYSSSFLRYLIERKPSQILEFHRIPDQANSKAHDIVVDDQDRVWVALEAGILRVPADRSSDWDLFQIIASGGSDQFQPFGPAQATSIDLDSHGNLWAALTKKIAVITPEDHVRLIGASDGLIDNHPGFGTPAAATLMVDSSDRVWFGNFNASSQSVYSLQVLDTRGSPLDGSDDIWETYSSNDGMLRSIAREIAEDAEGKIWLVHGMPHDWTIGGSPSVGGLRARQAIRGPTEGGAAPPCWFAERR